MNANDRKMRNFRVCPHSTRCIGIILSTLLVLLVAAMYANSMFTYTDSEKIIMSTMKSNK